MIIENKTVLKVTFPSLLLNNHNYNTHKFYFKNTGMGFTDQIANGNPMLQLVLIQKMEDNGPSRIYVLFSTLIQAILRTSCFPGPVHCTLKFFIAKIQREQSNFHKFLIFSIRFQCNFAGSKPILENPNDTKLWEQKLA